jgi:diguanylate cyclase (GGDEF)-like protein
MNHTTRLTPSELIDLLEYAPIGVLVEDCTGRILWLNQTLEWQLGIDGSGSLGAHVSSLPLAPIGGARGKRHFRVLAGGGALERDLECIEDVLPEFNEDGIRVRYFLEATRAARALPQPGAEPLHRVRARPLRGAATGVCDVQTLMGRLRAAITWSRRHAKPLSVLLVTVDVPVRDGPVVDHPSRVVASAQAFLRSGIRWSDIIGRFGDRKFLLVLPETALSAATELTTKMRSRLDDAGGEHDGVSLRLSLGVAELRRGDDEFVLCERAALAASGGEEAGSTTRLPDSR